MNLHDDVNTLERTHLLKSLDELLSVLGGQLRKQGHRKDVEGAYSAFTASQNLRSRDRRLVFFHGVHLDAHQVYCKAQAEFAVQLTSRIGPRSSMNVFLSTVKVTVFFCGVYAAMTLAFRGRSLVRASSPK